MNDEAIMTEAERALKVDLTKISDEMEARMLPSAAVANLHSNFNLCEDGVTQMALVDLVDGNTAAITICPGQPIVVCVVT